MKELAKLVWVAAIGLGGCASIPPVSTTGVQPSSIVSKIECEIYVSAAKPGHEVLKKRGWIAVAALTLQGDDMFGVNPSLSYINPLSAATNFMFPLGGTYNQARQQIFSLNVTFNIEGLGPKACEKLAPEYELTGNLGLDDIIDSGLTAIAGDDPAAGFYTKDGNAFGSTLKFVITKGASGGPNWTLTHFTGPGGGSGLFSANRIDTQQLIISFAPQDVKVPPGAVYGGPLTSGTSVARFISPGEAPQGTRIPFATAVMNAQNNNLNMLFQSLRTVP